VRLGPLTLVVVLVAPVALAQQAAPWPNGAFNPYAHAPIRIFLDDSNLTDATRPYADTVRAAWAWWEAGGNGALRWQPRFNETKDRAEADVIVWFVEAPLVSCGATGAGQGCGGFGGPAYAIDQGEVFLATEISSTQPGLGARHIPYEDMQRVAEHELGHALGLPHSSTPTDIMYPQGEVVSNGDSPDSLSQRQIIIGLGLAIGGIAVIAGSQRAYHATLNARDRRRSQRTEARARQDAAKPLEPGEVRVVSSGGYVRLGRCAQAPDGEHRFEARRVVVEGTSTTWMVCRLCRHPKKL
jgi:Matrixin